MFTRKHYVKIAEVINEHYNDTYHNVKYSRNTHYDAQLAIKNHVHRMADMFADDNDSFVKGKFVKVCLEIWEDD